MRKALLIALSLLLLAGCTTTVVHGAATYDAGGTYGGALDVVDPGTPVAEHTVEEIAWQDCTDLISAVVAEQTDRDLEFQCGVLQVPVDYYDPETERMPVALIRTHLAGTSGQQPLLVNPGGPGGAGTDLAVGLAIQLDEEVLAAYDIVGFDPRGTGQSDPIHCVDMAERDAWVLGDPAPITPEGEQELKADVDEFAAQCAAAYPNVQHLNTMATARDMDQLRASLGMEKLNYIGYSYGTKLGAVYATLFPDRVGAFVLDGAVDLKEDKLERYESQIIGFEQVFDRFAADCVATGCPVAPDPRQVAIDLIASTRDTPLTSTTDDRLAGPSVVITAIVSAMYTPLRWPELSEALADGVAGDGTGLFALADDYWGRFEAANGQVYWSNLLDANFAINCADTADSTSFEDAAAYADTWGSTYPLFGRDSGFGLYGCTPWAATRYPLPDVDASAVAGPVLVIGTTNDPATPYAGAISLTEDLGGPTTLLTYDGDGHTAYPGTSACIDAAVNAYLLSGTAPAAETVCSD